ncbi:hypothetical protein ACSS6W_006669 [Trichoderma asperelloides]
MFMSMCAMALPAKSQPQPMRSLLKKRHSRTTSYVGVKPSWSLRAGKAGNLEQLDARP